MGSGPDGPMQFRSISDTLPKIIVNYLILLENISFVNIFLRDNIKKCPLTTIYTLPAVSCRQSDILIKVP